MYAQMYASDWFSAGIPKNYTTVLFVVKWRQNREKGLTINCLFYSLFLLFISFTEANFGKS